MKTRYTNLIGNLLTIIGTCFALAIAIPGIIIGNAVYVTDKFLIAAVFLCIFVCFTIILSFVCTLVFNAQKVLEKHKIIILIITFSFAVCSIICLIAYVCLFGSNFKLGADIITDIVLAFLSLVGGSVIYIVDLVISLHAKKEIAVESVSADDTIATKSGFQEESLFDSFDTEILRLKEMKAKGLIDAEDYKLLKDKAVKEELAKLK